MEVGHNITTTTAKNIRMNILSGCVVDSFTMRARAGERVECTFDFFAKQAAAYTSQAFQSLSRSTKPPFGWGHCVISYADDGTETERAGEFTAFEFTINNNITRNYALASDGASTLRRSFYDIIPGRQEISGTATINVTTTSGMDLYDALMNDATAPYVPAATVKKKQFNFDINNRAAPATQAINWTFRDVVIGEIPMDIDPTKVQEITFPWTASYYQLEIITADVTNDPTNWDDTD